MGTLHGFGRKKDYGVGKVSVCVCVGGGVGNVGGEVGLGISPGRATKKK